MQNQSSVMRFFQRQVDDTFYFSVSTHATHRYFNWPRVWWRSLLFDTLWLAVVFGLSGLFFWIIPLPRHTFRLDDHSIANPLVEEQIPMTWTILLTGLFPVLVVLLFSHLVFGGLLRDTLYTVSGVLQSIGTALFITSVLWILHGGLRPNFLDVCKPNHAMGYYTTTAGEYSWTHYDQSACTQPIDKDQLHGFPSGHAATAWAGWLFVVYYLSSRIRLLWDPTGHYWKFVLVVVLPLLIPTWVSLTRVFDYYHFWYQVIAGFFIGLFSATFCYRILHHGFPWDSLGHVPKCACPETDN